MLKNENIKLDERRKNDIRGYQTSIRLLKDDMKTVVHQIYKVGGVVFIALPPSL